MNLYKKILLLLCFSIPMATQSSPWYQSAPKFAATIIGTVALTKASYDFIQCINDRIKSNIQKKSSAIPATHVGIIAINGDIDNASTNNTHKLIEKFSEDTSIQGVIVVIDSSGGQVGYDSFLYNELKTLRSSKPVVTVVPAMCCSAAYLIACASNTIIASNTAEIGSIGVILRTIKFNKDHVNLKQGNLDGEATITVLKAGEYKTISYPLDSNALTNEQKEHLQQKTNQFYDIFCSVVAEERKLNLAEKNNWANGKVFIAPDALKLGLIDQIGSFIDAKREIFKLIKEKNPQASNRIVLVTQ